MVRLMTYVALCASLFVLLNGHVSAETKQPNIVFCFADDWGRYAQCYATVDDKPSINSLLKTFFWFHIFKFSYAF